MPVGSATGARCNWGVQDPRACHEGKAHAWPNGGKRITVQGLKVILVDPERNLLIVRGAVPGANGGLVLIRQARKTRVMKRVRK